MMVATLIAVLPIVTLVTLLTAFKLPAWKAALASFVFAAALAFFTGLGLSEIALASVDGFKTALYPIGLVIVGALFVYGVSVESGELKVIKEGLAACAPEPGLAALLIVWGFGNFMEGMAGFGTSVAIPVAILVGIGFDPLKAVLCSLVANTTPTAFGSVGVPTMILAQEAGVDLGTLTTTIALLQVPVTLLGPFLILFIVGGFTEVKRHYLVAASVSVIFVAVQLGFARLLGCELPDILGGIVVMFFLVGMRKKKPGRDDDIKLKSQFRAWAPFVSVVVVLCAFSAVPVAYKPSPGILLIAAGLIGAMIQRVPFKNALKLVFRTAWNYRLAMLTVCLILALAKTMDRAGMIRTIADTLVALTGGAYPFFAPFVGNLGGFVTGSGTSTCVLFGKLQSSVGAESGHSMLYAAANVMGAGIGKMLCPQSIVLGCAAAGLAGCESTILAKVFRYFIPIAILAGLVTVSYSFLKM